MLTRVSISASIARRCTPHVTRALVVRAPRSSAAPIIRWATGANKFQCLRAFSSTTPTAATPASTPSSATSAASSPSSSSSSSPSSTPSADEFATTNKKEEPTAEEEPEESNSKEKMGPVSWGSFAFLCVVGGGAVIYFRYQQDKALNTVKIETIGTPLLGGPWSLMENNGKRVNSSDLHGQYVLLYFGFTHCPDICPTELKKMEEALKQVAQSMPQHKVVPIFITIDPKRDTVKRLAEYKKTWDPNMRWMTGSADEVAKVARSFRVYYSAPETAEGSDEDYLVDHSIFFYLMDREGKFMEFFGKSKSAEEVSARMMQLIAAENKSK